MSAAPGHGGRRAHRQADRARRPVLAARCRALDRRGPGRGRRPVLTTPGGDRDRGERRHASTASRCPRRTGRGCSATTSPPGVLTAARDPEGRPTIYDRLPDGLPRLMPVGRLDLTSEGLLLLTNDGALKRAARAAGDRLAAALPGAGPRRGRPRRRSPRCKRGITIDGFDLRPDRGQRSTAVQGSNAWLTVALREGKNREIRRVLEHFGWPVTRLIRLSFGPFQLGRPGAPARSRR